MRKVKSHKGFVIAFDKKTGDHFIFTKDEWSCGAGLRYSEWQASSLAEAIEWIG